MDAAPCPVCGAGAATRHCPRPAACDWLACPTCAALIDPTRLHEGRPRHTHGSVQAVTCLLCSPRKAET